MRTNKEYKINAKFINWDETPQNPIIDNNKEYEIIDRKSNLIICDDD